MTSADRLAAICLLPILLVGPLHVCAEADDSAPLLAAFLEEPDAFRPGNAPLPLEGGPGSGGSPLVVAPEPPRVFQQPATEVLPPDLDAMPDVQFSQTPGGNGGCPLNASCAGDTAEWGPGHYGLFGRQPLRQMLRDIYGPIEGRNRGMGRPMTNESWLFRPFSAGWFMGAMVGGPLIDDWLGISHGYTTGFRFGWDQNYYWGLETQFTYAEMGLWDSDRAKHDRREWYVDRGWDTDDPALDRLVNTRRSMEVYQFAVSAMYYPWGDSRWRPYLSLGVGGTRMQYTDIFTTGGKQTFFVLPIGIGIKYHWNDWLAVRFECSDSISVPGGGGLRSVHNVSFNGALELRFGGARTAYWPWNPGRAYW